MWRVSHSNYICYLKDFKKEQDLYKRRLYNMKPVLKITQPYRKTNNNKGYSFDNYKTKYDNKILYKKTKEINNSKSIYNQHILRPNSAFSGVRNSNFENYLKSKRKIINEDNIRLRKRLKNIKPVYSVEKMNKSAKDHEKYREFMLEVLRKNRVTPLYYDEMENILNII